MRGTSRPTTRNSPQKTSDTAAAGRIQRLRNMGNPQLASQEKGEKIYSRMIDIFVRFLEDLKKVKVKIKERDFPGRY